MEDNIQYLKNQNKFLKDKLQRAVEGNITNDPIVNKIIRKHLKRHKDGMARFGKRRTRGIYGFYLVFRKNT